MTADHDDIPVLPAAPVLDDRNHAAASDTSERGTTGGSSAASAMWLLAGNAAVLVWALVYEWPLSTLVIPYWMQGVILGGYHFKRILALERFSTGGLSINDSPVARTAASRNFIAAFFLVHYGFFHLVHLGFMLSFVGSLDLDGVGLGVLAFAFIVSAHVACAEQVRQDRRGCPNLGTTMFEPYVRVFPMHAFALAGGWFASTRATDHTTLTVLFVALKTMADLGGHCATVSRGRARRSACPPESVPAVEPASAAMLLVLVPYVFVLGGAILLSTFVSFLSREFAEIAHRPQSAATRSEPAPVPTPTEAAAMLVNAQDASWEAQGIQIKLPPAWTRCPDGVQESHPFAHWERRHADSAQALGAKIIVVTGPSVIALDSVYGKLAVRADRGEVVDLCWHELDGRRGVRFREVSADRSAKASGASVGSGPRTTSWNGCSLNWMGDRMVRGQPQRVWIRLFAGAEPAFDAALVTFYGVLYTTKLARD